MVKKLLRIAGILLLVLLLGFLILYGIYNEPVPTYEKGPRADALAKKMLRAINHEAYKNTRFFEWTFAGGAHSYKWDKKLGKVDVKWDGHSVKLNLNNPLKSLVYEGDTEVNIKKSKELTATARNYFNNDSFWLVAPFKVFDKGTERGVVRLADGSKGLLVTYTSGGTTPGDTYLWKLGPNGFPESYRMWVKIIPIGGIEATWDDWKIMENGLFLPTSHDIGPMTLDIGEVRAYN